MWMDVISTCDVGEDVEPDERLYLLSHRWALDSADTVVLVVDGDERAEAVLPMATASGLVAMKLGAFFGRRRDRQQKRPTDAYGIYRLLADLDVDLGVAESFVSAPRELLLDVCAATQRAFIDDVTRTRQEIRRIGDVVTRELTEDDLIEVGGRFLGRLRELP
jgi:hypothetical protein